MVVAVLLIFEFDQPCIGTFSADVDHDPPSRITPRQVSVLTILQSCIRRYFSLGFATIASCIVLVSANASLEQGAELIARDGSVAQLMHDATQNYKVRRGAEDSASEEPGAEGAADTDDGADDCDDGPATVYVTVTVDGQGQPQGTGAPGDSSGAGGGAGEPTGGAGGSAGECTEGCYTGSGSDTASASSATPTATGGAGGEGTETSGAEGSESQSEPTGVPTTSSDEWDDWGGETGSPSSASGSASASASGDAGSVGGGSEFSGAPLSVQRLPIAVAIAVCALTSVAAGLLFTGM